MQFQVPQNIAMEDHIIGSLNPIQFGILVLGGLASFTLFTNNSIKPVGEIIGGFLGFITVLLAVGKFNDQPLYRFFRYIIAFVISPKVRVWHKHGGSEVQIVKPNPAGSGKQVPHTIKKVQHGDIARLAAVLDSRGAVGPAPQIIIKTEMRNATPSPNDKQS